MGKDELVLKFALAVHMEIPVGSYCVYPEEGGTVYSVLTPESVTIRHRRAFEYTVTLEAPQSNLRKHRLYNPVDGRLKFDYTAQPQEHLQLIIDNLNERYGTNTWAIGSCITDSEKLISFKHSTLLDALNSIAETFGTEWEIGVLNGRNVINLGKIEYNASSPLELSYGKGNGFVGGVTRTNYDNNLPIGRVYIEGGERNIDYATYPDSDADGQHSRTLVLPRGKSFSFDGEKFNGEDGYVSGKGVAMVTDDRGFSVSLADAPSDCNEESLELTDIYPHRVGRVTSLLFWNSKTREYVDEEDITDWDDIEFDIVDTQIPNTLDYSECLIAGEKMTIVFQTGMLTAREFDVAYRHEAVGSRPAKRFEIVKDTIDGITMPNEYFRPVAGNGTTTGDQYGIFGIMLPAAFIEDDTTHSGAMWDLLREAAKYLYQNRVSKYTFKGELDGLFAKRNWSSIKDKLVIGGYVRFSDPSVIGEDEYYDVRIASVKEFINNPHTPVIEMTDEAVYSKGGGLATTIRDIESETVHTDTKVKDVMLFTKRSFRDSLETASMIESAFAKAWGSSQNPVTIRTMQMLVGDESLQIAFWTSAACTTAAIPITVSSNGAVSGIACYLQHLTLRPADDKNTLTTARAAADTYRWHMTAKTFTDSDFAAALPDVPPEEYGNYAFYIYAVCSDIAYTSTVGTGAYTLSATPITSPRHFLIGILNSVSEGTRSFAPLYGFTEILPSQITTNLIRSRDGYSSIDLDGGKMRLGGADKYIAWNQNNSGVLEVKGAINVSPSGATAPATVPRGPWVSGTSKAYYGDVWTFEGSSWLCVDENAVDSAHAVGTDPSAESSSWQILAEKGADGEDGEDGQQGPAGPSGYNTAEITVYRAGTTVPPYKPRDCSYNFATGALTGTMQNWSTTIPTVGAFEVLYQCKASVRSQELTVSVPNNAWGEITRVTGPDGLMGKVMRGINAFTLNQGLPDGSEFQGLEDTDPTHIFYDVVYVGNGGERKYYYCKVASYNNQLAKTYPPETSPNVWVQASNFDFIATKVLIASNAFVDVFSGNAAYMYNTAQNRVVAGMQGGSGVNFFAGTNISGTPTQQNIADAPFRVHYDGSVFATKAYLQEGCNIGLVDAQGNKYGFVIGASNGRYGLVNSKSTPDAFIDINNVVGSKYARLNTGDASVSARNDGGTAIYGYSQGDNGLALFLMGQAGAKALESYGNLDFILRSGESAKLTYGTGASAVSEDIVSSGGIKHIVTCTADDYPEDPDENTLYIITDAV